MGFQAESWIVLSTSEVFLLGKQFLVLSSLCSSFSSLHLLSTMLFVIVYLQLNFWFYWFDLECIPITLFGICCLVVSEFSKVSAHWHVLNFFYWVRIFFFFKLSHFFFSITTSDTHGILQFGSWFGWYAFCCCFHVSSDNVFIFTIQSISFRYFLKSIKFLSPSYSISSAYISIGKWGPVITCDFDCFLFLHRLRCIFAVMILWSEGTPSKEEYTS